MPVAQLRRIQDARRGDQITRDLLWEIFRLHRALWLTRNQLRGIRGKMMYHDNLTIQLILVELDAEPGVRRMSAKEKYERRRKKGQTFMRMWCHDEPLFVGPPWPPPINRKGRKGRW